MNAPAEVGGQELGQRTRPPWLVRHGIWFVLAGTAALFVAGAVVRYNRVVTAPLRAAGPLRADRQGRVRFLVRDGDAVGAGQVIATIDGANATATALLPHEMAGKLRLRQPATIVAGAATIPATITAISPAQGDVVAVTVMGARPLPAGALVLKVRVVEPRLLGQILQLSPPVR